MFSGIVFDFDGTLVDSTKSIFDEYVRVAGEMKLRPISFKEFTMQLGKPWDAALEGLWPDLDKEGFNSLYRREIEKTPVIDGVIEVLADLRIRYSLGLLTSRGEKSLNMILKSTEISKTVFEKIFTRESLKAHKPDPSALVEVAEKMVVPVSELVYVGDSVVDAECAKKAGVFFVGVLSGGTEEQELRSRGINHIIDSVADLPKLLRELQDEA